MVFSSKSDGFLVCRLRKKLISSVASRSKRFQCFICPCLQGKSHVWGKFGVVVVTWSLNNWLQVNLVFALNLLFTLLWIFCLFQSLDRCLNVLWKLNCFEWLSPMHYFINKASTYLGLFSEGAVIDISLWIHYWKLWLKT